MYKLDSLPFYNVQCLSRIFRTPEQSRRHIYIYTHIDDKFKKKTKITLIDYNNPDHFLNSFFLLRKKKITFLYTTCLDYANLIKKYTTRISLFLSLSLSIQITTSIIHSSRFLFKRPPPPPPPRAFDLFTPQPDSTFPGQSSANIISLPVLRGNNNNNARRGLAMAATGGRDAAKAGRKGPRSADRGSRSHKFVLIASDVTFCFNYAALSGR